MNICSAFITYVCVSVLLADHKHTNAWTLGIWHFTFRISAYHCWIILVLLRLRFIHFRDFVFFVCSSLDTVPLFSLSFHFHSFFNSFYLSLGCFFVFFRFSFVVFHLISFQLLPPSLSFAHIRLCFHRWPINFESMFKYPFWMAQHLNEYRLRTRNLK